MIAMVTGQLGAAAAAARARVRAGCVVGALRAAACGSAARGLLLAGSSRTSSPTSRRSRRCRLPSSGSVFLRAAAPVVGRVEARALEVHRDRIEHLSSGLFAADLADLRRVASSAGRPRKVPVRDTGTRRSAWRRRLAATIDGTTMSETATGRRVSERATERRVRASSRHAGSRSASAAITAASARSSRPAARVAPARGRDARRSSSAGIRSTSSSDRARRARRRAAPLPARVGRRAPRAAASTALRLVSALFAVASLPVDRRSSPPGSPGGSAALVATALAAASWTFLFHGVYGRMYSLFLFTSALSYLALLRALERGGRRPGRSGRSRSSPRSRRIPTARSCSPPRGSSSSSRIASGCAQALWAFAAVARARDPVLADRPRARGPVRRRRRRRPAAAASTSSATSGMRPETSRPGSRVLPAVLVARRPGWPSSRGRRDCWRRARDSSRSPPSRSRAAPVRPRRGT